MTHTLTQIWKESPSFLNGKSFRQIIQMAGDGRLKDGSQASKELREWLQVISLDKLRACADECLQDAFDESGLALQDVVNQLGVRVGFEVEPGRYRGKKTAIGNDGLWRGQDGFAILVEVKTTDAYRINLDTIAQYRDELVSNGSLSRSSSSIVIAVGRQDTGDMEAQIRGSRHAWDVRLVSIDALLRLADVKQQLNDWDTSTKINQLLRPMEYTRLDGIVELLFAAKQDMETPDTGKPLKDESTLKASEVPKVDLEAMREKAIAAVEKNLGTTFVRRGKALRASVDSKIRLVCLASQDYGDSSRPQSGWYGFTPAQKRFLEGAEAGYLALACVGLTKIFMIPKEELIAWLPKFLTTPADHVSEADLVHWHLYFYDRGNRVDLMGEGGEVVADLTKYVVGLEAVR